MIRLPFVFPDRVDQVMRRRQEENARAASRQKTIQCHECLKMFVDESALITHTRYAKLNCLYVKLAARKTCL